jgi:hypothetical protein
MQDLCSFIYTPCSLSRDIQDRSVNKEPSHPSIASTPLNVDQVLALALVVLGILATLLLILGRISTSPTPLVVLVKDLSWDTVEQLLGVDAEQRPSEVERLVDGARFVRALSNEGAFELLEELERQLVFRGQGFLSDDGLHGGGVTANGILGVELVGHVAVVFPCAALADGGLHETGEGGQDVDGWVDTLVVELTVDEDLAFRDVTRQVGDRMCDVCRY